MTSVFARLAVSILFLAAISSAATITVFTDQSSFTSATSSVTSVNFTSVPTGSYNTSSGFTVDGINIFATYISGTYLLSVVDPGSDPNLPWGTRVVRGTDEGYIQLNFASATAIALNLATYWTGKPLQISLSTGESFTVGTPSSGPTPAFWGFTSDTAETWVRVATIGGNGYPVIVNFQYGSAAAQSQDPPAAEDVPETTTLVMIGLGLFMMRSLKRFTPMTVA